MTPQTTPVFVSVPPRKDEHFERLYFGHDPAAAGKDHSFVTVFLRSLVEEVERNVGLPGEAVDYEPVFTLEVAPERRRCRSVWSWRRCIETEVEVEAEVVMEELKTKKGGAENGRD